MPNESFRTVIEQIARRKSSSVSVFADFCRMGVCALAMGSREPEYLEVAARYSRDELSDISRAFALLVQEMETKPFSDLLGPFYLEVASASSKAARGEYYTPPAISKLMAGLMVDAPADEAAGKPITIMEPACGSGGMVLAIAEQFAPDAVDLLRVTAHDINPVAADMAYINLTLWGIPAKIVLGDTIRMTVDAEWRNVHWHRVGEEHRLKFQRLRELITAEPEKEPPTPPTSFVEMVKSREASGQLELNF